VLMRITGVEDRLLMPALPGLRADPQDPVSGRA